MKPFINIIPKNLFYSIVIMFALMNLVTLTQVSAQDISAENITSETIPYQDISSGSLYFKNEAGYFPALTQNSDYQVNVNGLLARVNFTQTFKNFTDNFLEAVYVFPLIADAAVDTMVMEIGERRIVGNIKEKQQALKLYNKAKQQGKKASLVTQQRPNLFTTKLANIAPGETIKISISYLQSVAFKDETFSLRIPLTLTPRFIPAPRQTAIREKEPTNTSNPLITTEIDSHGWAIANARVSDADEITPLQMRVNGIEAQMQTVTLDINLQTGLPLAQVVSLYHPIKQHSVSKPSVNKQNINSQSINKPQQSESLTITLATEKILLDQDFVLQWQLSQGNVPKAAFFTQPAAEQSQDDYHYGLLMVMPPKASNAKSLDKEVVYIVDKSGSMGGVAMRQAKQALEAALDLLNEKDSFNIIAFDNKTSSLFPQSKSANASNITWAKHWLSGINASGGTNMYPAIERALRQSENSGNNAGYRQVIFITDGSVGNEDELLRLIDRDLANTRLHTIGIGSAPNGYFMSQAAKVGRGTYRYIGSINAVKQQMTNLFSQISKPLMKNIKVIWPASSIEMFPQQLPDLYAGEPLLISARWEKSINQPSPQLIKISGELAATTWQEQMIITEGETQNNNADKAKFDSSISQWWARKKIDHLTLLHRRSRSADESSELKSDITRLALKHHLVSPYTSFIAIEEQVSRKADTPLTSKGLKNLMPKGSTQAVPLANTALGLAGYFYLSVLFIMIALVMRFLTMPLDKKLC